MVFLQNMCKVHLNFRYLGFLAAVAFFTYAHASTARAQWTLNVAFQDPVGSTIGVNAQYFGGDWAFEGGLGPGKPDAGIDESNENRNTVLTLFGDVAGKYFFLTGFFKPYAGGGLGIRNFYYYGKSTGFDFVSEALFPTAGFLLGEKTYYGFMGAAYFQARVLAQIGFGFPL